MDFSRVLNSMKNRDNLWYIFFTFFFPIRMLLLWNHLGTLEATQIFRKPIYLHKSSFRFGFFVCMVCYTISLKIISSTTTAAAAVPIHYPNFPIHNRVRVCNYAFRCIIVCHIVFSYFVLCCLNLTLCCALQFAVSAFN